MTSMDLGQRNLLDIDTAQGCTGQLQLCETWRPARTSDLLLSRRPSIPFSTSISARVNGHSSSPDYGT
eukprot:IDg16402t1